jgi:hypothetical protein
MRQRHARNRGKRSHEAAIDWRHRSTLSNAGTSASAMSNVLDERPRGGASKGSKLRAKRAPRALYGSRSVPSVVRRIRHQLPVRASESGRVPVPESVVSA